MKYKLKLITGFRRDQEHSIEASEAHKAYYLFDHPTERGTFSNGLAIKGDQIQEIVPDYQGTMDWNATHVLDSDDMNELHKLGVDVKMRFIMSAAKDVARFGDVTDLQIPLSQLLKTKYPQLAMKEEKRLVGGMKQISQISHE